jgi:hypothetical protein
MKKILSVNFQLLKKLENVGPFKPWSKYFLKEALTLFPKPNQMGWKWLCRVLS